MNRNLKGDDGRPFRRMKSPSGEGTSKATSGSDLESGDDEIFHDRSYAPIPQLCSRTQRNGCRKRRKFNFCYGATLDNLLKNTPFLSSDNLDSECMGDASEDISTSPSSNSDVDPGLPRNDYLDFEKCGLCGTKEKDISYPYCVPCFQKMKNSFPRRPKKKKKNSEQTQSLTTSDQTRAEAENDHRALDSSDLQNGSSICSLGDKTTVSINVDGGIGSTDLEPSRNTVDGSSQPSVSGTTADSSNANTSEPCKVCFKVQQKAVFVHLNCGHLYRCYTCAKEIYYQRKHCPYCKRRILRVAKLYI